MSTSTKGWRTYAAICVAVVLAFAACSPSTTPSAASNTNGPNPTANANPTTIAANPTATAAPKTFVYAVPSVPTTLDYATYEGDANRYADIPMVSRLVLYDPSSLTGQGCGQLASISNLKAELATTWTYSPDRKVITFKLRDAKSEFGNTLTAADVVWSIQRAVALGTVAKFDATTIADYVMPSPMVAVDSSTVELHVKTSTSMDVALMSLNWFIIYDSQEAKKHATTDDPWAKAWLATNSDTFGPWHVSAFVPGQQITYVPNPNYWGPRGNISTFILKAVPDAGVRGQLVQSGDADWAARLTISQYTYLQGVTGVTVKQCVSPNRDDLVLQQKGTKFADVRVREAISLAIDRDALVKGAYGGYYKPAITGLTQYYAFSQPYSTYKLDVAAAKQLLAAAGYANGFAMTMIYNDSRPGPWADQSSVLIKSMLSQIGINVTLKLVGAYTDFNTQFTSGAFEAALYQEPPLIADPYFSAAIYNVSTSFQNHFGFKDPAYDQLVSQIAHSPAGPDRDALVSKLADLGVTDYPVIYLTDDVYLNAFRSNISGMLWDPSGDLFPHEYVKS
jgi:peptide/nickel transport system substrate-binding protein